MTSVQRATKALTKSNIPHNIVELDASATKRGCAFGIEIPKNQLDNAEKIMRKSGIRLKDYIEL